MYLSSKHQSTGDLGGMRYPNRLLSKNLPLCTCNYPFYSAYNSLNHRVNFGQFKLCTDIEKNPTLRAEATFQPFNFLSCMREIRHSIRKQN